MLFIPFFVLVVVVVVLALPCMSNYRKIYASSDQLICSLSNDFLHFSVLLLSLSWFMPQWQESEKFPDGDKSFSTTTSTMVHNGMVCVELKREHNERIFWLTRLHSAKWMSSTDCLLISSAYDCDINRPWSTSSNRKANFVQRLATRPSHVSRGLNWISYSAVKLSALHRPINHSQRSCAFINMER